MKNLQKVLALGLALVMLLGMMSFASAAETETKIVASNFPDWSEVTQKDAMSLIVDLKIINGTSDGKLAPKATIDRSSWSKMLYFALTGDSDASAYIGAKPVLNDIGGKWAEGYITYLVTLGIASGDNKGNYNPSKPIKVVEAAKMLLTGLGYDAGREGYVGSGWANNIMADAKRLGIMAGVAQSQNEELTRENAARMIFNAMGVNMVELRRYTGDVNLVTGYNTLDPLGYALFNLIPATATVSNIANGVATFSNVKIGKISAASTEAATLLNNAKLSAPLSSVGKTVTVYLKGACDSFAAKGQASASATVELSGVISSSTAAAASAADKTVTAAIAAGNTDSTNHADWSAYVAAANTGVEKTWVGAWDANTKVYKNGVQDSSVTGASSLPATVSGDVVEFYTDGAGKITSIMIYNYKVAEITADPTVTTTGDKSTVTCSELGLANTPVANVTGLDLVKKGAVVLFWDNGEADAAKKVVTVETPASVVGKTTAVSSASKVTVNGTEYAQSGLTTKGASTGVTYADLFDSTKGDFKNEYTWYLDKNGDVCYVYTAQATVATDDSKFALILRSSWVAGTGELNQSNFLQAELLFEDGTKDIVTVKTVGGKKVVAPDTASPDAAKEVKYTKDTGDFAVLKEFFNYTENDDGTYALTKVAGQADIANASAIVAKPVFGDSKTANNKTLFVVKKGDTYDTFTGYAALPGMTLSAAGTMATGSGTVAKYVYLETNQYAGEAVQGKFYLVDATTSTTANGTLINVIDPNGAKTTLLVDVTTATEFNSSSIASNVGKLFEINTQNADGKVTAVKNVAAVGSDAVTNLGNSIVTVGSKTFGYDSETKIIVIDLDKTSKFSAVSVIAPANAGNVDTDTVDTNAKYASVYGVASSTTEGDVLDFLYVVRTAK